MHGSEGFAAAMILAVVGLVVGLVTLVTWDDMPTIPGLALLLACLAMVLPALFRLFTLAILG